VRDIEKAILLYKEMAERFEKCGIAPHQAAVYGEMADFMADCETAAEASVKIKNSPYYLKPSVALMQDKFTILRNAAMENHMPELAEVYEKKLAEIEADNAAIYETGYEKTAQNVKIKYTHLWEQFARTYEHYVAVSCCAVGDKEKQEDALKDLRQSLAELSKSGEAFSQLAQKENFRKLILANDNGYEEFCREAELTASGGKDHSAVSAQMEEENKAAWEEVRSLKDVITQVGRENLKEVKTARTMVVSPDSKDGVYEYIGEEVR